MINITPIQAVLIKHYSLKNLAIEATPISGGDIHQNYTLSLSGDVGSAETDVPNQLFAKYNSGIGAQVLESEFESLTLINSICPDLYPQPILFERFDDESVLLMSFHAISPLTADNAFFAGQALALQHKNSADTFGWPTDNYIGLTPQANQRRINWIEFFAEQRLRPILSLALNGGLSNNTGNRVDAVIKGLAGLLDHSVIPSLLHGDLWSDNLGFEQYFGSALFYDPAPYYGDREADLAMTELFGRLPDSFYQAYQQAWPLEPGYERRLPVYNLYHALNHVVLFGASYNGLVENCLKHIDI